MPSRSLLDTSAFIRWLDGSLPRHVKRNIEKTELLVSIVTPWEIAIKPALKEAGLTAGVVARKLDEMGARLLPVTLRHTDVLCALPLHHKDPFDRMIIAQALAEDCMLVSPDQRFPLYGGAGLSVLWE
jgi:PIN domain nuclease of toxin-antitoxin system